MSRRVTERPFHVFISCEGWSWVGVSLRYAPRRSLYDMMKLEVSSGGDVDYSGEAPLRLTASDVPPATEGLLGPIFEANLLAQRAWNDFTDRKSPASSWLKFSIGDLPVVAPVCGRDAAVFEGADEICAMKADTIDERLIAGLAFLRLLESIHARWERGEHRDGLPPTWVFVHGNERRWAYARPI